MRVRNRFFGIQELASLEPGIRESHISRNCSRIGKTHSTRDMYSRVGEHISLVKCVSRSREAKCVSWVEEHISLGIVPGKGKLIPLGICVRHIPLGICVRGEHVYYGQHILL